MNKKKNISNEDMEPVRMIQEGSIPPYLESLVVGYLDMIKNKHPLLKIPTIAITGGGANET